MKNIFNNTRILGKQGKTVLMPYVAVATLATILTACAAPQQGPMFYSASQAIRAAHNAGAVEFAPEQLQQASATFNKAETMHKKRRGNRAQKLLELATAQANLAKATSEAKQAEASLSFLQSGALR